MRSLVVAIAAVALLPLLPGCKSRITRGAPTAAACAAGAEVSPGPTGAARSVTGKYGFVHWLDDGTQVSVPLAAAPATPVQAMVPITGGYDVHRGTLRADGSVTIADVPPGRYFLAQDFRALKGPLVLVEHEASALDLSRPLVGRADVAYPQQPIDVTVSVSNLEAWADGDAVLVHSANAQLVAEPWGASGAALTAGETSASRTLAWEAALLDSAKGDSVQVYQLSTRLVPGGDLAGVGADYRGAARGSALSGVTLTAGQAGTIAASLSAPAEASLDLDVRHGSYAALAPKTGPAAVLGSAAISVSAVPHATAFPGPWGQEMPLLQLATSGDTDWTATGLAWSRFHASPWSEIRRAVFEYAVSLAGAGAAPAWIRPTIEEASAVPAGASSAWLVAPSLTPPEAPQVAGRDALTPQSGVCLTPELSWSAPATGRPTSYRISVVRLASIAGKTEPTEVLSVRQSGTRLRVPNGLLEAGKTYAAVITAFQAPWDVVDAPDARGFPYAAATVVTAPFVP